MKIRNGRLIRLNNFSKATPVEYFLRNRKTNWANTFETNWCNINPTKTIPRNHK